jgi:type II secretion system protein C
MKEPAIAQMLDEPLPSLFVPAARSPAARSQQAGRVPAESSPVRPGSAAPVDWRARAPRLTATVLAVLGVAEVARLSWDLLDMRAVPGAIGAIKPAAGRIHWWRLSSAHLFGMPPTPEEREAEIARARPISWALTGVIATDDPSTGFAIVGERGKTLEVLKAGSPLEAIPGSRLSQIFSDHVVIDLQGRLQSVELPRQAGGSSRGPGVPVAMAAPEEIEPQQLPAELPPPRRLGPRAAQGPVESLLAALNPEPREAGGRLVGMTLHPSAWLQRQFGLREGDVLTAVNGTEVAEPGSNLANAMRSGNETVSITYTRDGVEQTVTMQVGN